MADFLSAVDADGGTKEPTPVTIVAAGAEVALVTLLTAIANRVDAANTRATGASAFTSVASQVASISLLAANPARRGALIINTDANTLYVDLTGGAAGPARHGIALATNGRLDVPFGYTGAITGAWAVDGTGAALVTEFA